MDLISNSHSTRRHTKSHVHDGELVAGYYSYGSCIDYAKRKRVLLAQ